MGNLLMLWNKKLEGELIMAPTQVYDVAQVRGTRGGLSAAHA